MNFPHPLNISIADNSHAKLKTYPREQHTPLHIWKAERVVHDSAADPLKLNGRLSSPSSKGCLRDIRLATSYVNLMLKVEQKPTKTEAS